jgi:predicted RNA-binding protein with PUA-like domain
MKIGDLCIIYHSSCKVPAAVGIGKIVKEAYADPLQFDPKSDYYDATSPVAKPRWLCVDVAFVERFAQPVTLTKMRTLPELTDMRLLSRGNRLSVIQISKEHFTTILKSV